MKKNWKTSKWRTYWLWIKLRKVVRMTSKWEKIPFEFYGKFERGQTALVCYFQRIMTYPVSNGDY